MTQPKLFAALLLGSTLSMTTAGFTAEHPHDTPLKEKTHKMEKSEMSPTKATPLEDAIWLEEVEGKKALAQVNAWNAASAKVMKTDTYKDMKKELLEVYNSPEKIPYVSYRGGDMHNFWQDDTHVRGIWRKTDPESYLSDEPNWETILDFDKLAKKEDKNWVYKGNNCLAPAYTRCIVNISIGGKDAVERREFNADTGKFVKDGFMLTESKGSVDWLDEDHLVVGVDFGEGTMTDSGYPMVSKLWDRGTPLEDAMELMRGEKTDVGVWSSAMELAEGRREILVTRAVTFYDSEYYWIPDDGMEVGKPVQFPVPMKSNLAGEFKGQMLLKLNEDWRDFNQGDLVSFNLQDFFDSGEIDDVHVVYSPDKNASIENFGATKSKILMSVFEDVTGQALAIDWDGDGWTMQELVMPKNGSVSIGSTNGKEDIAFISTESFLTPDTLWMVDTQTMDVFEAKSLPAWFDADSMEAKQHFATSADGTKVPYYVVGAKGMKMDGKNPALLYGYGGFEISINPSYSATIGRAWLERGGVYVSANIRGGGEYGPKWHQAGLKTKRQVVYDDFIAVAEDLIDKDITSPEHLGIHGRSNGGLLMGVMFTQRPDLFNAVVIGVPLLDMQRYHKLLAGASWVGEYGDPEDEGAEGEFIRNLSPYHNLKAGVEYPEPYIYTSTKDDRVHPAHARKFAKRLEDLGLPFQYYENIDGGHAGAANLDETSHSYALIYSYLAGKLMDE